MLMKAIDVTTMKKSNRFQLSLKYLLPNAESFIIASIRKTKVNNTLIPSRMPYSCSVMLFHRIHKLRELSRIAVKIIISNVVVVAILYILILKFPKGSTIAIRGTVLSNKTLVYIHFFYFSVSRKFLPSLSLSLLKACITTPTKRLVIKKAPKIMNKMKNIAASG